jgi:segregation and condensation protein B
MPTPPDPDFPEAPFPGGANDAPQPAGGQAGPDSSADSPPEPAEGPEDGNEPVPPPGLPDDLPGQADPSEPPPGEAPHPEDAPPGHPELPPSPEALRIAEALVFASGTPVTAARLAPLLPPGMNAAATLAALAAAYEGRGVTLVSVAGGYAFRTAEDLAPALTRVVEVPRRLPRVAMEALAIIAWHQPVTRAEIEEIRGTALSQNTLETLLENGLVAPRGKKEAPGRPTLWGTTSKFLEQFGLNSLRDLPKREELLPEPGLPLPEPVQPGG